MDEENKKVNNDSAIPEELRDFYDEIVGSAYSMVNEYSDSSLTKEEKLKREAEKKKEAEMEAIRLDIERRYALEVEESKRNIEAVGGRSVDDPEDDKVRSLDEMINLEAFTESEEKLKKSKKVKAKKKKELKFVDLDEKNAVYASIYSLGDFILKLFSVVFRDLPGVIIKPIVKALRSKRDDALDNDKSVTYRFRNFKNEFTKFRKSILNSFITIIKSFRHPLSVPSVIAHFIKESFKDHLYFLKTVVNFALPVLSIVILVFVYNYWNNVTFALQVYYNDKSIGYISDESVFIEAKNLVLDRLSANNITAEETTSAAGNLNARYELSLVSLDELNDARTISDKMIEESADNLTHACGIYIDGKFICSVKNEADAKTVFNNILAPYQTLADEGGYVVGLLQDIDYVQGLYRDDESIMWDASQLESYIASNELINIKKMVTTTEIVSVPFSTVTTHDVTKYSGYREVKQEGIDGNKRVTTTRVYVDGEYSYSTISDEILLAPTDEILVVGTRTTYGGIYIGQASEKGFLWPAPSCHYVSSPYGWRSSGWHKGIDLCTGRGRANGTPVIASRSGVVEVVQHSGSGYGNMVLINHGDGYKTRYAHMLDGSVTVKIGDKVEGGQAIGKVGSTGNSSGPHLHFEVIYNGETQDPKGYIS